MLGHLGFETDWDYSVNFKGKKYTDTEFLLPIESLEDIYEIRDNLGGPFGRELTQHTKVTEVLNGILEILDNPTEYFSNQGGNRGIVWYPNSFTDDKSKRVYVKDEDGAILATLFVFGETIDVKETNGVTVEIN